MSDMENKITVVVDRIEENTIAVIEMPDLSTIEVDKKFLPKKVKEGNVLDINIKINPEEEKKRLDEVKSLQQELLKEINGLNIGPMGLGGKTTALAVNIQTHPTHIAGLPVAVNICCHALRSATKTL